MSRVDESRRRRRKPRTGTVLWTVLGSLFIAWVLFHGVSETVKNAPAPEPSYESPESRASLFVSVMRQTTEIPADLTDRQLILRAYDFCDLSRTVGVASAAGLTYDQAEAEGYPIGYITSLTTVGTNAFCPQHSEALEGYLLRPDS